LTVCLTVQVDVCEQQVRGNEDLSGLAGGMSDPCALSHSAMGAAMGLSLALYQAGPPFARRPTAEHMSCNSSL
jgi:hypothetical protein